MHNFLKKKGLTKILLDRRAMTYDIVEYETKNSDNNEKKNITMN